ncbi:uncharacterized protein DSM5745_03721 [Aspergillus mulundensis]|uniref:Uncharacterized protein n=1 Tax=Aspergillus mulundensis TaxID=1810919 RepID=A0A3D8SL70_9EURO|nr:hypothetical protein DSM5745_03721 [Aspergillus mulundensis]RDW87079.1 hypothetical protein DSM5745_03721 [Aspergillus mulundensis]
MSTSKRMDALIRAGRTGTGRTPRVDTIHGGWYNAPDGKEYFGVGVVTEIGITHDGSTYVNAEPQVLRSSTNKQFRFFDPLTDEDMPLDQYPEDIEVRTEQVLARKRRTLKSQPKSGLGPGEIWHGYYESARGQSYDGVGKIIAPLVRPDGTPTGYYALDPSRVRGVFPLQELYTDADIVEDELPRSPYTGSAETQRKARENTARPLREENFDCLYYWYGKLPRLPGSRGEQPRLGRESAGAFFAPDGQWFAGVGKVVTVGCINRPAAPQAWYVYVEPISDRAPAGRDYDFFHPVTREWMDELPSNPIPGVQCSIAQRRALPSRWRHLPAIRRKPEIGEVYPGRYCPPKAPRRDVYVGVGKVVSTGVDEQNRIWVEVVPVADKRGKWEYLFWDPWSGKRMPERYWPAE